MTAYAIMGIRLVLVLTFLIGMPVLALPQVADWCEARLYAPSPKRRIVAARVLPTTKPTVVPVVAIGDRTPLPWADQAEYAEPVTEPTRPPTAATTPDLGALAAEVQALGATFYRLEQVGKSPGLYQFTAQFERAGAVPQRTQFVATAPQPADAIQQVIDQIQAGR